MEGNTNKILSFSDFFGTSRNKWWCPVRPPFSSTTAGCGRERLMAAHVSRGGCGVCRGEHALVGALGSGRGQSGGAACLAGPRGRVLGKPPHGADPMRPCWVVDAAVPTFRIGEETSRYPRTLRTKPRRPQAQRLLRCMSRSRSAVSVPDENSSIAPKQESPVCRLGAPARGHAPGPVAGRRGRWAGRWTCGSATKPATRGSGWRAGWSWRCRSRRSRSTRRASW